MKTGEKGHVPRPRVRRISRSGQEANKAGMQWLRGREVPGVEGEGGMGHIPVRPTCSSKEAGFILHPVGEHPDCF